MTKNEDRPFILGLGGTTSPNSSTEQALAIALQAASDAGAETALFGATELCALPHYRSDPAGLNETGKALVDATPLGVGINSSGGIFKNGVCADSGVNDQLRLVAEQVMRGSHRR